MTSAVASESITAMILAAGKGTRMRPLTDTTPKPLLEVAGQPLIEWHLQKLKAAGVTRVVVNCAYLAEKVESYFSTRLSDGLEIFVINEGEPLETAGGIANALAWLGNSPFMVINGDVWTDLDYSDLVKHSGSLMQCLGHLVLVPNPEHNPDGDFVLTSTGILKNLETSGETDLHLKNDASYTFSGLSILHPELFSSLSSDAGALGPHLRRWINDGKVSASVSNDYWLDVGTPERLAELDQRISLHS